MKQKICVSKVRNAFLFVFILCLSYTSFSQSYFELGGGVGASNYSGDMSPSSISKILGTSRLAATGYVRYNIHPHFHVKASGLLAKVHGKDSWSDKAWQIERNLSFFTDIYELSLTGEVNIFKYEPLNGENVFTIYLMGGVGGFYFNPKAELDGKIYQLQKLGTEGQGLDAYPDRKEYKLLGMSIPFGGGIKLKLSDQVNLNSELGWRFTFTDYIDDVSGNYADYNVMLENRGEVAANLSNRTGEVLPERKNFSDASVRGNPDVKDYFFAFTIGLSYNMVGSGGSGSGPRVRRKKSKVTKCPRF